MNIAGPSTKCEFNVSKKWNHYVLASESCQSSDDDGSETAQSIQAKETDLARDTSDIASEDFSDFEEYELASDVHSDADVKFVDSNASSTDDGIIKTTVINAVISDGDFDFADSEESAATTDSELSPIDYWKCARCHNKNNNPLFRYCEKCYKVRKDFFPPPPKHKKKKNRKRPKKQRYTKEAKYVGHSTETPQAEGIGLHISSNTYNTVKNEEDKKTTNNSNANIVGVDSVVSESFERGVKRKAPDSCDDSDIADIGLKKNKRFCNDFLTNSLDLEKGSDINLDSSFSQPVFSTYDNIASVQTSFGNSFSQPVFSTYDNIVSVQKSFSEPSMTFSKDDMDFESEKLCSLDDGNLSLAKVNSLIEKADKSVGIDIKEKSDMCITCLVEPKSGVFVHGRIAHICCCYKCSVKVWVKTKRCPICKCKVSNVLRAFMS